MNTEFQHLQEKVTEIVRMVHELRAENTHLRVALAHSQQENQTLAHRIELVSEKITRLIQRTQT